MEMDWTLVVGLAGVPVVVALTQLVKPFFADTRAYPFISIVWALAINLFAAWMLTDFAKAEVGTAVILGLLAGLSAGGLYSAGSTIREGAAANKDNRTH